MKKLLIILIGTLALVACSSDKMPQQNTSMTMNNCSDARNMVKSNNMKIGQAFNDRDANAIGTLELQNRDIVQSNMQCFPKLQKHIKYWQKMHKDGDM